MPFVNRQFMLSDEHLSELATLPTAPTQHRWGELHFQRELYGFIRETRPQRMVETGVCETGISTWFILHAMDENREGLLWSIDPFDTPHGHTQPPPWTDHPRWVLVRDVSERVLIPTLEDVGPVDVFLHDSDHEYPCQAFEYAAAWDHLRLGGHLLSDDTDWTDSLKRGRAWPEFLARHELLDFAVGRARGARKV